MQLKPTVITTNQWQKVLKSLYYSAASGFSAGFMLSLSGVIQSGNMDLVHSLSTAAIVGGVVGALNSLAVTVKQLFTTE